MQFRLMCQTDRKINAIKTTREITGWLLKPAKDGIECGLLFDASKSGEMMASFLECFNRCWKRDWPEFPPPTWKVEVYRLEYQPQPVTQIVYT